jgi:UDP-N-acetylmuramoyl-L-alanyl-D-glutamate--2,6-diaminopimelate ligase
MRFHDCFSALPDAELRGGNPEIAAICADSREARPGCLFVAVPGYRSDGHEHIGQALERGAAALVLQRDHVGTAAPPSVPFALLDDTRSGLAAVAAAFYGFPERLLRVIGVTGTDGKTTTSYLINAVLEAAGASTGLLGTVDFKIGDRWERNTTRLTTPPAPEVQELLARMAAAAIRYAILESTSHGLELRRLDHCGYDVAVFTNLSPDHLDQHGTMEAYRAAKGMLFAMLDAPSEKTGSRYAVLNADDAESNYFRSRTSAPVLTYGLDKAVDVRAEEIELGIFGARFRVRTPWGNFPIDLPMPGLFNVSNALAAVSVGLREGISEQTIATALQRFAGVPGRMERIDAGQPFGVIVDYAHTGEALSKVLRTVRPATSGRIIAVFGSAGERGHTRRSGMAAAAAELADFTVLTDEDPRFEDPEEIIDEMATVMRAHGRSEPADFVRVLARQEAIALALGRAKAGDLVLVAGKGHEQSIEIRGTKLPWDDRAAVRSALAERGHRGPA